MAGEGGQRSIAPRRDGPAVLGAAAGRRVRHLAARRGDGRRQPARGGGAAARAARGPRLSAGGDGARAGARYDAAPLTAPAAGDRCARRPRAVASPGDELARESLDVTGLGDRAIVQGELDVARRGLLPGDTLRLRAEAWDNAPAPHVGRSAEIALRLPSLEELRAALRTATQGLVEAADSIADSQRDLGERTGDLAQQRSRDETTGARRPPGAQSGSLPFQATERAQAVAREQEALEQRVQELSKAVEEIARAAKAAGIDDTAFQARLREVQEMLQRAVTPELEQRLRELQEALAKLDPEAARQALQRLAEAQQQLKAELERSRELFRRAATEGALASLAADAEDLKRRQNEWNRTEAVRPDSAAAARERALAQRAGALAQGIEEAARDIVPEALAPRGEPSALAAPQHAARRAQGAMGNAAEAAEQGQAPGAEQAGQEAERELEGLPEQLRARRDSLSGAWKRETLAALDR